MIIATNPTVEGEATAYYLNQMAEARGIRVSRIAHGVPLGGELEYTTNRTLAHAFGGRQAFSSRADHPAKAAGGWSAAADG